MTDGPLIVQSDKTLLLEVDHPARRRGAHRDRAVRRARARAGARAHLPGDPAGAVERPRRGARRRAGRRRARPVLPVRRCRSRCWWTSSTRWAATGGCSWSTHPAHGLTMVVAGPRGARGGAAQQEDRPDAGRPDRRRHRRRCTRRERGRLKQVLLKVGWPAEDLAGYVDGEAHADRSWTEDGWELRDYQRRRRRGLLGRRLRRRGAALRRRARRWSARPRWPRRRRPR